MVRRKKISEIVDTTEDVIGKEYDLLPIEVVERRTAIENLRRLELTNAKEALTLEERKNNICRIDVALSEFDKFLVDFVEMLTSLPDTVQGYIPECKPEQYAKVQEFIDGQLQRLANKRLYLSIESTAQEKARATAVKNESIQKNAKIRKVKK